LHGGQLPPDMSGQAVVLTEEIDDDYEPTEQELKEYADWLGMDLEEDKDLLWIARRGLKAPLPHPWKPCQTQEDGEIFYFNFETGESVWDHPCDDYHRNLYERERAKKRGEAVDEGSQGEGEGSQSMSEGKEKKEKKAKKEKKEKKRAKEEKTAEREGEPRDLEGLPKQLEAPSSLPPLAGSPPPLQVGEASATSSSVVTPTAGKSLFSQPEAKKANKDEVLEISLGESMVSVAEEAEEQPHMDESPVEEMNEGQSLLSQPAAKKANKDEVLEISLGESMVSAAEEQPHMDESRVEELHEGHADVGNSRLGISSLREGDTLEVSVSEDQIHSKLEGTEARLSTSEIESLLTEAEASVADLKSKLEADTAKQKKDLEEWHKDEARKCAKQRQEWQAEFEDQRDATFSELQAEHEKRVREEKQRLQQELTSKKKALKEEMDVDFEQNKEQLEQIKDLKAEKDKLAAELSAAKKTVDEQEEARAKVVTKLEKELSEAKESAKKAACEVLVMREKVEGYQAAQADAKCSKDGEKELQEQLTALQEEKEKLNTDLLIAKNIANDKEESLTADITKLQKELQEVKAAATEKSSELSRKDKQLEAVQAERDFALDQSESLKQDLGNLRTEAQRLKSETQTQVTELAEKLRVKTDECEQLMEKSLDLTDRLMEDEGSQHDAKKLQAQLSEKTEEVQWVKAEKKVLEERVERLQADVDRIQAEAARADTLASELKACKEHAAQEARLQEESNHRAEEDARRERERLTAEVAHHEFKVKALEAEAKQMSDREAENARLAPEVTRLKGELVRMESQERALQRQLETAKDTAERAEAEGAEKQEELERLEDKSAAELRQSQAMLHEARLATERASADSAALQREVSRLQAKADAAERIRTELGNLEGRTIAAEAAAAEAARSTSDAHWRQEVQRLEAIAREKTTELTKMREQAQRSQEEVRRMEQDERRASQRITIAQEEADVLRKEVTQLREDASEAERHVEDIRANLRAENNLRLSAEANLRKSTREISSLGDQLAMQTAAAEQFAAEARRFRAETSDLEAEHARCLQQLRAFEVELNHGRAKQDAKEKQCNSKLAMHWYDLAEQEYGISAREARVHERERRVAEAAKLLEEQRQALLHGGLTQRHPDKPTPVSLEARFAAGVPVIEQPPDLVEDNLVHEGAETSDGNVPKRNATEEIRPSAVVDELATGEMRDTEEGYPPVDSDLDTRRQELRRERAAFEELRQQCRAQMARLRRTSPEANPEANVLLQDMQGTLDAHAHVFNKSVNELRARVKQRASKAKAMQAITPARTALASTRSASLRTKLAGADWDEQCELSAPATGSYSVRPRTPHSARSTKGPGSTIASAWTTPKTSRQASREVPPQAPTPLELWEQDAMWLRGGGGEPRIYRSTSARAAVRIPSPRRDLPRGW